MWNRSIKGDRDMSQKKEKKKNRYRLSTMALLAAAAVAVSAGGLTARYVHQRSAMNAIAANEFYFTSDLLTESGETYKLAQGTTELELEVRNYADDLRWSGTDIEYTYTVTKDGDSSAAVTGSGKIVKQTTSKSSSKIEISGLSEGTYTIVAESTAPFVKSLQGKFEIPKEDSGIEWKVEDSESSPYALLTVKTKEYTGDIKIEWPDNVIPDTTKDAFSEVVTWNESTYKGDTLTLHVEKISSYTFRFFKQDVNADYSSGEQIKASATN